MTGCSQHEGPSISHYWKIEPIPLTVQRPHVEVYEVEFLPILPETPGTLVVGHFRLYPGAQLDYANEEMMLAIKKKAADIGGNTIVYSFQQKDDMVVAYVPTEQNLHGGDEYADSHFH